MKTVVLSCRLDPVPERSEVCNVVDARWITFLQRASLVGVPCLAHSDAESFMKALGPIAGIILTGGNTLSSIVANAENVERDRLERSLLDEANRRGLPVLGVCRGMQFLAENSGDSVVIVEGHVRTQHELSVSAGSKWLSRHAGTRVNSYHRYCAAGRAKSFRVSARSEDGAVEAIESDDGKRLGIMWHPEREQPFAQSDIDLFRSFFA